MTLELQMLHFFFYYYYFKVSQSNNSHGVFMEYSRSSELEEKHVSMPEHMVPYFQDHVQVTNDPCVAVWDKHRMDKKASIDRCIECVIQCFLAITF